MTTTFKCKPSVYLSIGREIPSTTFHNNKLKLILVIQDRRQAAIFSNIAKNSKMVHSADNWFLFANNLVTRLYREDLEWYYDLSDYQVSDLTEVELESILISLNEKARHEPDILKQDKLWL